MTYIKPLRITNSFTELIREMGIHVFDLYYKTLCPFISATGDAIYLEISTECYSSIAVYGDEVFAACAGQSVIHVYRYRQWWSKVTSFTVSDPWNTLSVHNNRLKCCSRDGNTVDLLTLTGDMLLTYGDGFCQGQGGAGGEGQQQQLHTPTICDQDADGSVLIANRGNDRVQVMSERGYFSSVHLQPAAVKPDSVVLFRNDLFVTSWSGDSHVLSKYVG